MLSRFHLNCPKGKNGIKYTSFNLWHIRFVHPSVGLIDRCSYISKLGSCQRPRRSVLGSCQSEPAVDGTLALPPSSSACFTSCFSVGRRIGRNRIFLTRFNGRQPRRSRRRSHWQVGSGSQTFQSGQLYI